MPKLKHILITAVCLTLGGIAGIVVLDFRNEEKVDADRSQALAVQ